MWDVKLQIFKHGLDLKDPDDKMGERIYLPMIDGVPVFYPTYFVTTHLRNNSPLYQRSVLNDLKMLAMWEYDSNITLTDRITKGIPLTDVEIQSMANFLSYDLSTVNKIFTGVKLLPTAYHRVKKNTLRNRIKAAKKYFEFLYPLLCKHPEKETQLTRLKNKLNGFTPRKINSHIDIERHLTEEQLDVLLDKIAVGHDENPWGSDVIQTRNALMIHTLYETGMRKSELLGLYIEDIDLSKEVIRIRRRHHDPADPRRHQPHQKTKERDIPVPSALLEALHNYVLNMRGKNEQNKKRRLKHPVLFVSHSGKTFGAPISISGFESVSKKLIATFPVLQGVHYHLFRHHFNYRFSKMLESSEGWKDMSPEEKAKLDEQTRADLMGWVPNGVMQKLYNARYYKELANKVLSTRSARFKSAKNGSNK